jgi:hypothetical protein
VLVDVATLVEGRERVAGVHDHVGAGGVLHAAAGAPTVALGAAGRLDDAGPQRLAGLELGGQARGADEAVAVGRLAAGEADRVQHAVAVERMVAADRRHHRVLGVAQVHAGELVGDATFDDVELVGVPLVLLRPPRPGPIRMVVGGGQPALDRPDDLRAHRATS